MPTAYVSSADLARLCGLHERTVAAKIEAALRGTSSDLPGIQRTNQDTGIVEYNATELVAAFRTVHKSHDKFPSKKQERVYNKRHSRMVSSLRRIQHGQQDTSQDLEERHETPAPVVETPSTPQPRAPEVQINTPQPSDVRMFHDEEYLPVRQELETVYANVESLLHKRVEGSIDTRELAATLGDLVSDAPSEETLRMFGISEAVAQHSRRLQILAFDTLVRSLNTLDPADTASYDALTQEIVFQLTETGIPAKRAYLTGILMHYLDAALAEGGGSDDGILGIVDAAERCAAFLNKHVPDEVDAPYLQCCTDMMNGFHVPKVEHTQMSEHERELEEARLIAALYDNPRSVMDVDLGTRTQSPYEPATGAATTSELLTANPGSYVILPRGYAPSEEKILEAIRFGWRLGPAMVIDDPTTLPPRKRPVILCPTDDAEVRMLIRAARDAKNVGDLRTHWEKLSGLEAYARSSLDPKAAQEVRDAELRGDRVEVRLMTIRDKRIEPATPATPAANA